MTVHVIGAGLAGCEAAWALANQGIRVCLYEMKPQRFSPAHHSEQFAELVCSNSLKARRLGSAAGMLKEEMRMLGSLTVACAEATSVAAGGALAVDRDAFSALVTKHIRAHALIEVVSGEVTDIPLDRLTVIATGPLTSDALAARISELCGGTLSFYDAAAPIVTYESLDLDRVFFAARYDRGDGDYINCPFNKEEYEAFYEALRTAEPAPLHDFDQAEKRVYEGCMPIEIMARRGPDTIRYGPLKPVGLRNPRTGHRPWAVVQLRRENSAGTLYNLVGFQTNLRFGEQKRVFSMIPGLAHAEFMRYGVMHRNTFLDSPRLLDRYYADRRNPLVAFAGQMTGVEGYVESTASGYLAAVSMAAKLGGAPIPDFPKETAIGALSQYISDTSIGNFQPMNVNFGIMTPLGYKVKGKANKNLAIAERSLAIIDQMVREHNV